MIIRWYILAPSLTHFQSWYSYYNQAFRKMPGVRRDYVLNPDQCFTGIQPPTVVAYLLNWMDNPRYDDPDILVHKLKLMGYQYDKAYNLEWAGVFIIPYEKLNYSPTTKTSNLDWTQGLQENSKASS